jgi:two-component system, NtrC family, sensor histidine kinase KinB
MKRPIRTRFTLGMIFLFLIILVLSVFSGYYLNQLSTKTGAILKENYLSVVYARDLTEGLENINQEITTAFLTGREPDTLKVASVLTSMDKSLLDEKNNITEPGEDKLVSSIESDYAVYRDSLQRFIKSPETAGGLTYLQDKSGDIYQQLSILSQMNGRALEVKTEDAKSSANSAVTKMTVLATLCFLIGMSFTISFASYFQRRFFELYNEIKEIVSGNIEENTVSAGKDEFDEISGIINKMAEKLKNEPHNMPFTIPEEPAKGITSNEVEDLKLMLFRIKVMEEQAASLISKFEKKQV